MGRAGQRDVQLMPWDLRLAWLDRFARALGWANRLVMRTEVLRIRAVNRKGTRTCES